ncbi:MAG: MFS transporter [Actinomycetota bacterium]
MTKAEIERRRLPVARVGGFAAVFIMVCVAGVAQSFGRFAFGVVLPAVRDDLGLSNTVAGTLTTVNVGAYLIGTFAVAWATGRYKLLDVMRIGFAFALVGLGLTAIAPNAAVVAVAMFCSGFGGALTWIPAPVVATDAVAPERRSMVIALMGTGMGSAVVLASQLSSWVRSSRGDGDWRLVYVILFAIGAVVLVAATLLIGHDQDKPRGGGGIGGFTALKRMPGWLPLTAAYTAFGLMYLLVLAFLTTKLEDDNGWTSSRASLAFTLVGIAMIFGGPVFIALGERIGARLGLTTAFVGWSITVVAMLPGWSSVTLPAAFLTGMLFAGIPTMITLYVVRNTSVEDYGPAFSAATLAFGLSQMISPQLGGAIADLAGSFTPVFIFSAALAVVGAIAALQLAKPGASQTVGATDPAGVDC